MGKMLIIIFFWIGLACSTENLGESFTEDTDDDRARKALEAEQYQEAAEIYERLIAEAPEEYSRYPLLASAYAGLAGVSLLDIIRGQLEGDTGNNANNTSAFAQLGQFVPNDPNDTQLNSISTAISRLEAMPADHRSATSTYAYGPGAAFQLNLYLTLSSAMLVNTVTEVQTDGSLSEDRLEELTVEEVDVILENLDKIVENADPADQSVANEALNNSVEDTLAEIEAQPGADNREKLINYLEAQNGGSSTLRMTPAVP